jgi:transmembrane sensor
MTRTRRNIVLLDGEAYFDVARNDRVPFIVSVGETRIQAVGTAFSVQKRVDRVEVTVTEGVVQVEQDGPSSPGAATPPFQPMLLRAGQVAQVSRPGMPEIKEIEPQEMARKLLWQQKMLAFDGNTLQEVVDEYSRYTPFTIRIVDAETAAIRVGGYFRSDDVAGLLTSLEDNFSISVKQTDANSFELQKK